MQPKFFGRTKNYPKGLQTYLQALQAQKLHIVVGPPPLEIAVITRNHQSAQTFVKHSADIWRTHQVSVYILVYFLMTKNNPG